MQKQWLGMMVLIICVGLASLAHAGDYTTTLTVEQEIALQEATEQANLRRGILYATGAAVTNGSTTVSAQSAVAAWGGRWVKITGDAAFYRITAVTDGASVTLATPYAGTTGTGKDMTLHPDNGALPTSAAVPDLTKAQVLQGQVDGDLGNNLRNLDARIMPVLANLKALDAATQQKVLATEPSLAVRSRAAILVAQ